MSAVIRKSIIAVVVAVFYIAIHDLWIISVFPDNALPEIIFLLSLLASIFFTSAILFKKHSIHLILGSFALVAIVIAYKACFHNEISNRPAIYSMMIAAEEISNLKTANEVSCEKGYELATINSPGIMSDPYSKKNVLVFRTEKERHIIYSRGVNGIDENGLSIRINHSDIVDNLIMYRFYKKIRSILSLPVGDDLAVSVCLN